MATVHSATRAGPAPGAVVYDGFISYSHAADGVLAPRLQAGLQRFGKPWWRRRVLRMFRDEASLSANPHLWASITEAMSQSAWFVLMLSEDAARSEWVDREVAWWLEHKDPSRIIPVVTDGEFGWSEGDIDPNSTVAPRSLFGAFGEEPRWVDLRFARTETALDLRHAVFRNAIADIASAIRGVPKDELESEEIRQHRRTIRTAWSGAIALLVFGVAAAIGAVVAVDQSNEARAQRDEAQRQAQIAEANAAEAERQAEIAAASEAEANRQKTLADQSRAQAEADRDRAEANAAEAERQTEIAEQQTAIAEHNLSLAQSRELARSALEKLDTDPELSILLSLEAIGKVDRAEDAEALGLVGVLRTSLARSRIVLRIPGEEFVEYSPDGALLATGEIPDAVIWDADTGRRIHTLPSDEGRQVKKAAFSPDGLLLAVGYEGDEPGPLVVLWDVGTGQAVAEFDDPELLRTRVIAFSPDGALLAAQTEGGSKAPMVVWEVASGIERYRIQKSDRSAGLAFSPDGRLLAVTGGLRDSTAALYDAATGAAVASLDVPADWALPNVEFDPTGRYLAAVSKAPPGVVVWNVASRRIERSWEFESGNAEGIDWSPSGELVVVAGDEGIPRLFDVATGIQVLSLPGADALIDSVAYSPRGDRVAAAEKRGDTLVWDVAPSPRRELATIDTPYPGLQSIAYSADGGSLLVLSDEDGMRGTIARIDPGSGEVLATIPDVISDPPISSVLAAEAGLVAALRPDGSSALHDAGTFELIASLAQGRWVLEPFDLVPSSPWIHTVSDDGTLVLLNRSAVDGAPVVVEVGSWREVVALDEGLIYNADFSPDGTLLSVVNGGADGVVVEIPGGTVLATFDLLGSDEDFPGRFSPDGSFVAVTTLDGRLKLLEVAALRAGATKAQASSTWEISGAGADSFFSSDGSLIASVGDDGQLRVWSTATGRLVADFGALGGSSPTASFHPDGVHLIAEDAGGTIQVLTTDTEELLRIAVSRLTRGFTADECLALTEFLDPCPTLEEIRARGA